MSDPGETAPPPTPGTPQQRNGCLSAIMVLVGIVLLLPGLCALIFGGMMVQQAHVDSGILGLVVAGLAAGLLGVLMLVAVIRGRRS